MAAETWAPAGPARFQLASVGPGSPATSELSAVATPAKGAAAAGQPWNPDNPLFWFAGLAALTFGLMAFSTSVRVGKTTAAVSVGTT